MERFDYFISFIIFLKVLFILFSLIHIYYKVKKDENNEINERAVFWKHHIEFVFIACMAILLIYLFNPRLNNQKMITNETKLLLYLFGFILLFTANWDIFIEESKFYDFLHQILV